MFKSPHRYFLWLSLPNECLVPGGACLLVRLCSRFCIFFPMLVSPITSPNFTNILRIEDLGVME